MVGSPVKNSTPKKTNVLKISDIPASVDIIDISTACRNFINDVRGLRTVKMRNGTRNALIEFINPRLCEQAREAYKVVLGNQEFELFFTRSSTNVNFNVTASENKLYVKYPEEADEEDIVRLLGDVKISKPENARNFFFATCKDIGHQCSLVKAFDNRELPEGVLSVKVAIDKSRKRAPVRATAAAN